MSLILEALKRSEAERRLGETPDLLAPPPEFVTAPARQASPAWFVAGIASVLLLAIAFAWWWFALRDAGDATDAESAEARIAAAGTPQGPTTAPSAERVNSPALLGIPTNQASAPTASALPPAPVALPNTAPDPLAPLLPPNTVTGNSPIQVEPQAAPPGERPIGPPTIPPVADPPASVASAAATPVPAATAPATAVPPPAADIPSPSVAPDPVASAVPAPAVVEESPASNMPERSDLPLAVRQTLPPLVLNMHLYRATPSERVVILDGKRLREGESAGDVQVIEIRSDGVVLVAQGQRFLLSRLPR